MECEHLLTGVAVQKPSLDQTHHRLHIGDARDLSMVADGSVQLVVTSPPYPMIQMWDALFCTQSPAAQDALAQEDGPAAFEAMHQVLDTVWSECARVLSPGGLLCINVGDATRSLGGQFQMYPNHARILNSLTGLGLSVLPDILWRKPNNSPNKFMGSGMLPGGAYVTYEHEYILIARKGGRRVFRTKTDRELRRQSAYFWEERNLWFSDLWTGIRGTRQDLTSAERKRSAAYPLALAHRLIQMYSVYGDTVLDPFVGTGTTMAAALASGRHSIGLDQDPSLKAHVESALSEAVVMAHPMALGRLQHHARFVDARIASGKVIKHRHEGYGMPVMTSQETGLELRHPVALAPAACDAPASIHAVATVVPLAWPEE